MSTVIDERRVYSLHSLIAAAVVKQIDSAQMAKVGA